MLFIRILASIIMVFDLCFKMSYYTGSRFASIEVKNLYYVIIIFRPVVLSALVIYLMWLKTASIFVKWRRSKKMFKDDIAYQKDQALNTNTGTEETEINCVNLIRNLPPSIFQHIVIYWLCYTGFIRMAYSDPYYNLLILFTYIFEVIGHTIPFILIQNYNNGFLSKYGELETLNIIFSLLSLLLLGFEIYYN